MTSELAALFVKLSRLDPRHVEALDVVVSAMLTRDIPSVTMGPTRTHGLPQDSTREQHVASTNVLTLRARLEAAHTCDKPGHGFEQLAIESGPRQWKCLGCGAIVTLPQKPEPARRGRKSIETGGAR